MPVIGNREDSIRRSSLENVVLLERLLSDKEGSNCSIAKLTSKHCDKLMPVSLTESSHMHGKYLLVSRLQTVFSQCETLPANQSKRS